jgi:DNA polymerase III epsilon subunit-like protein
MFVGVDTIVAILLNKNVEIEKIKEKLLKIKNFVEYKNKLYLKYSDFERIKSDLFDGMYINKQYVERSDIFELEKIKYVDNNELKSKINLVIDGIIKKNKNEFDEKLKEIKGKSYYILDTEFDNDMKMLQIAIKNSKESIFIESENIGEKLDFIKKQINNVEIVFIHGADNDKIILKKYGIDIDDKIIDTGDLIGQYFGESKKISLEYLIKKYNINKYKDLHNALNDVNAIYLILKKIGVINDNK